MLDIDRDKSVEQADKDDFRETPQYIDKICHPEPFPGKIHKYPARGKYQH